MKRLFAGLTLPETHRQRLVLLNHGISGARWVAAENLHVTLRFIGEVDGDVAEEIAQVLDGVNVQPFSVALKGLGAFGHPPHSVWAGVEDQPSGALAELHRVIDGVLVRTGLEPEGRKYTPHVTLARFRRVNEGRLAQFMESEGDLALDSFKVNGFTLFRSHLSHEGAHYESVAEYDFV